jgi:hypothetical protein
MQNTGNSPLVGKLRCSWPQGALFTRTLPVSVGLYLDYSLAAPGTAVDRIGMSVNATWWIEDTQTGQMLEQDGPKLIEFGNDLALEYTLTTLGLQKPSCFVASVQFTDPATGAYIGGDSCEFGTTPFPFTTADINGDGTSISAHAALMTWTGLRLDRINTSPPNTVQFVQQSFVAAQAAGIALIMQFQTVAMATNAANLKAFLAIVPQGSLIEGPNEPNGQYSGTAYAPIFVAFALAVKAIRPDVQILGPAIVAPNAVWLKQFFDAGGYAACDIISVHGYRRNESIDTEFLVSVWGQVNTLLQAEAAAQPAPVPGTGSGTPTPVIGSGAPSPSPAATFPVPTSIAGLSTAVNSSPGNPVVASAASLVSAPVGTTKPLMQTEVGFPGLRFLGYHGRAQASRVTLWQDMMDRLGVGADSSMIYYLVQMGYWAVPDELWQHEGPNMAAFAMRTRGILTRGLVYTGPISCGNPGDPGDKLLLANRYDDPAGMLASTIILRGKAGPLAVQIDLSLPAGQAGGFAYVDFLGNLYPFSTATHPLPGSVRLSVSELPTYFIVPPGTTINIYPYPTLNGRKNIAPAATVTYSGAETAKSAGLGCLTDGVFDSINAGDPPSQKIFQSVIPEVQSGQPVIYNYFQFDWATAMPVCAVIPYCTHPDNPHSALSAYDVERWDVPSSSWVLVKSVQADIPPTTNCYMDQALCICHEVDTAVLPCVFQSVLTTSIRIVVKGVTYGQMPDLAANTIMKLNPGTTKGNQRMLELRELEIY